MDIGKVAKLSGVPASTLRYYEEKGLIQSTGRNGLRRLFDSNIIERLSLIALAQNAGLSLDEIATMLTPQGAQIDRQLLTDKANQIDRKIKQLSAMRDGLRHAAACPAPSHFECPQFLRLTKLATKSKIRQNK